MSETLPVVIGGTVAIDNVKTPDAEHNDLLGGSASYASLAASFFAKPVHLVGIVGKDFPQQHLTMLSENGVLQDSLEHSEGCLLYTSPSPRDQRGSRMPSSA